MGNFIFLWPNEIGNYRLAYTHLPMESFDIVEWNRNAAMEIERQVGRARRPKEKGAVEKTKCLMQINRTRVKAINIYVMRGDKSTASESESERGVSCELWINGATNNS